MAMFRGSYPNDEQSKTFAYVKRYTTGKDYGQLNQLNQH